MIHARNHRDHRLAVAEGQHADLRPGQKFLDHHPVARSAELFVQHNLFEPRFGRGLVLTDQHALAEREPVRLDDDRVLAAAADVAERRVGVVKGFIVGGRDAVLLHQILAEHLARLNAGGRGVRAEGRDAGLGHRIHHAKGQRVVLCDHRVVDRVLLRIGDHRRDVGGLDIDAGRVVPDAAVARRAVKSRVQGAFLQRADDRVFASAAADDQNLHSKLLFVAGEGGKAPPSSQ